MLREWEKEKKRDRGIISDSSCSMSPTPLPPSRPRVEGERLVLIILWTVAWRTSRCYEHHSSGWASEGPLLQGPPRKRKSIEIRAWGRALKAMPSSRRAWAPCGTDGVVDVSVSSRLVCGSDRSALGSAGPASSLWLPLPTPCHAPWRPWDQHWQNTAETPRAQSPASGSSHSFLHSPLALRSSLLIYCSGVCVDERERGRAAERAERERGRGRLFAPSEWEKWLSWECLWICLNAYL